jgi:hypothetical protein
VTFNANNTVTYVPKRKVQAEPEMSPRDAHEDRIIVPNVALLVSYNLQRQDKHHDSCISDCDVSHKHMRLILPQCNDALSTAEVSQRQMRWRDNAEW